MYQELLDVLRKIITVVIRWRQQRTAQQFVVACKECKRAVPIATREFPFHSISVCCCLCGAIKTYRPSEVIFGLPHELVRQRKLPDGLHSHPTGKPLAVGSFR